MIDFGHETFGLTLVKSLLIFQHHNPKLKKKIFLTALPYLF